MNHCFECCFECFPASDIPGNTNIIASGPGKHRYAESSNDIICCVKRFAANDGLSQENVHATKFELFASVLFSGAFAGLSYPVHGTLGERASGSKTVETV